MLGTAAAELDCNLYASNISQMVAHQLHNQIHHDSQKQLKELLESITQQAPEFIKLSKLVEIVKDSNYDDGVSECTLLIEQDYSSVIIGIDPKGGREEYQCSVQLLCSNYNEADCHSVTVLSYKDKDSLWGVFGKLDKYMFWLARCGTKLLIDQNDCDTYYHEED